MSRVHAAFTEPPRPCDYLDGPLAALDYRVMTDVTVEELEPLLLHGWRRFGPVYFRPACGECAECVSLRIPVARFAPTPRQRRARRRCGRFRLELGSPRVDAARLELYARWHESREDRRGWHAAPLDAEGYFRQLGFPHPAVRELSLHDGERLVSVGIHDVTPHAWSAVYCFYDPEIARLSPGVANIMYALELARARGIPYVYLGYRVAGCASSRYKAEFGPHELLVGRPGPREEPCWAEPLTDRARPPASRTP